MAKDSEKVDAFMPWWIGDYLADTTHLTAEQHGAYLLLIACYWRNGGPLDADEKRLSATCRMTAGQWKRNRETVLAFFQTDAGRLRHKRIDDELASAIAKRKAAQRSANARWEHKRKECETDANALRSECSSPSPSNIDREQGRGREEEPPQPVHGQTKFVTTITAKLPPPLCDNPAIVAKAAEFVESCNSIGHPRTPSQWRRIVQSLLVTPDAAHRMLENSISKGRYTVDPIGVIEAKESKARELPPPKTGRHVYDKTSAVTNRILEAYTNLKTRVEDERNQETQPVRPIFDATANGGRPAHKALGDERGRDTGPDADDTDGSRIYG